MMRTAPDVSLDKDDRFSGRLKHTKVYKRLAEESIECSRTCFSMQVLYKLTNCDRASHNTPFTEADISANSGIEIYQAPQHDVNRQS
jgi:hypothetical protein